MTVSNESPSMEFHLDRTSGVPVYRQLIEQVEQALELGLLRRGDQLPTLSEVVGQLAVNPNTIHRAYQELESQGWTEGRPGLGTFVVRSRSSASASRRKSLKLQME